MSRAAGKCWIRSASPAALCRRAEPDSLLSETERHLAEGRGRASRRDEFVAGRTLLRLTLAELGGAHASDVRIEPEPSGRLRAWVGGSEWTVSVSHTRGLVACGVGTARAIGVDVEPMARPVQALRLARRFFSESETRMLEQLPEGERSRTFLALWTLKESLGKAQGRGVAPVLRGTSFALGADGQVTAVAAVAASSDPGWHHEIHALASGHWLAVSAHGADQIDVSAG